MPGLRYALYQHESNFPFGVADDRVWYDCNDNSEGLHTIYHQRCKEAIGRQIYQNDLQLRRLFSLLNAHFIPETALRHFDPHLHAFINLNTPAELEQAEAIYQALQKKHDEWSAHFRCGSKGHHHKPDKLFVRAGSRPARWWSLRHNRDS